MTADAFIFGMVLGLVGLCFWALIEEYTDHLWRQTEVGQLEVAIYRATCRHCGAFYGPPELRKHAARAKAEATYQRAIASLEDTHPTGEQE